jgi:hypothetical protein
LYETGNIDPTKKLRCGVEPFLRSIPLLSLSGFVSNFASESANEGNRNESLLFILHPTPIALSCVSEILQIKIKIYRILPRHEGKKTEKNSYSRPVN